MVSIVRQDRFIEATRDSGYKGTISALSELIDNSIQAGATRVGVGLLTVDQEDKRTQPRTVEVMIADNGKGMSADELRQSLVFGGSGRFGDRAGLGRFGMGLPNASVSQCQRVDVYSRKSRGAMHHTYLDVREVAAGTMQVIPEPVKVPLPAPYNEHWLGNPAGTLVVWKDCDRLDSEGRAGTLRETLSFALGRIFRHFIERGFTLEIDGEAVRPFDPMFLMPAARYDGDPLASPHGQPVKIAVPKLDGTMGQVEIRFSLLPEEWQTAYRSDRDERKKRHIDDTTGISVVRGGREIDIVRNPFQSKHWSDAWYRVEVAFSPDLDEAFGVTHTKQHARIRAGTPLWNKLRAVIRGNVTTLREAIVQRGTSAFRSRIGGPSVPPEAVPKPPTTKPEQKKQQEVKEFTDTLPPKVQETVKKKLIAGEPVIDFEALPGAPFFRTSMVGDSLVVRLNTAHPFHDRFYIHLPPEVRGGFDLMVLSYATAELSVSSDKHRAELENQRGEWSRRLGSLFESFKQPKAPPKHRAGKKKVTQSA